MVFRDMSLFHCMEKAGIYRFIFRVWDNHADKYKDHQIKPALEMNAVHLVWKGVVREIGFYLSDYVKRRLMESLQHKTALGSGKSRGVGARCWDAHRNSRSSSSLGR